MGTATLELLLERLFRQLSDQEVISSRIVLRGVHGQVGREMQSILKRSMCRQSKLAEKSELYIIVRFIMSSGLNHHMLQCLKDSKPWLACHA